MVSGKKEIGKWLLRRGKISKNEDRTEILQIQLEMEKYIFFSLFLLWVSQLLYLRNWAFIMRASGSISLSVCRVFWLNWLPSPHPHPGGLSSGLSVWISEPTSLFASDFSFKLMKQYPTCCNKESNIAICKETFDKPQPHGPLRLPVLGWRAFTPFSMDIQIWTQFHFTQIDHTRCSHLQFNILL